MILGSQASYWLCQIKMVDLVCLIFVLDVRTPGWLSLAEQEAETVSVCSSESFADQGYAASEGMGDSPSASPEDTVSLCPDPSPSPSQPQDDSDDDDDDEGCATWGSRYR